MTLLALQGVTKSYRNGEVVTPVLHGVDLSVEQGEYVALMGPSGSGKSTLMNLLGLLDRADGGHYALSGRDVTQLSAAQQAEVRNRTIGFVFQSFNLLARTSAVENVELPLLYSGVGAAERRARASEALERVGLGARLDHHPNQMSGGQQQRVAIARALVTRPRIILADEPTGNLDSHTSVDVMALFQALGRTGITVILVTHEPDIAAYAARVVTMRDGEVRADVRQAPLPAVHAAEAPEAHP